MRYRKTSGELSVHAIAGTHVVLFAMNLLEVRTKGLIGFQIRRRSGGSTTWLSGGKRFDGQEAGDCRVAPIQAFLWGDYEATPGARYVYTVSAVYGTPSKMTLGDSVTLRVRMEDPHEGSHGVFFNRGVAGSQAYTREFGSARRWYLVERYGKEKWQDFIKPSAVPSGRAWKWLSRGLEEGLLGFVKRAKGRRFSIRACMYELSYGPFLELLARLYESGVDVRVIHHAHKKTRTEVRRGRNVDVEFYDEIGESARDAIRAVGLRYKRSTRGWIDVFIERNEAAISHNKFIILLEEGEPTEVWTGSTNLTSGGLFGQANVGHVVRDSKITSKFLDYWNELSADPALDGSAGVKAFNEKLTPDTILGSASPVEVVFSPRKSLNLLDWYGDQIGSAVQTVHYTAAFGVSQQLARRLIQPVSSEDYAFLRYILLEGIPSEPASKTRKQRARDAGREEPLDYYDFQQQPENRIAYGDLARSGRRRFDWQRAYESLTGLNSHVNFVHTKFLLIDALTDDPLLITGSANFSEASTIRNDENMLVIRGDTHVADVYLTEFMRLFNHSRFRNEENKVAADDAKAMRLLAEDDSWTAPFFDPGCQLYCERELFA